MKYADSLMSYQAEFERLREKDKASAQTIDTATRKINKLQDTIQGFKQRIATSQRECDQRNRFEQIEST